MNKLKKLGKGLEDISYLFLSNEEENYSPEKKEDPPAEKKETLFLDAPAKSICLIGNSDDFRDAFLVINLSLALARMGMRIAVIDMDEELPCMNFFLGQDAALGQFNSVEDFVKKGPLGVRLVGLNKANRENLLRLREKKDVFERLQKMEEEVDLILISIKQNNLPKVNSLIRDSIREYVMLVSPDKIKMLSTYKIIKAVFTYNTLAKIGLIITDINHMYEIEAVYSRIAGAVIKFLDKELFKYGFLFKLKQEVNTTANMASFYDADLTACISNIAQIIVLRLNLGGANAAPGFFFKNFLSNSLTE